MTTVYVQRPTSPIIVRTPGSVALPVAVVRSQPRALPGRAHDRLNPKGVTTTTPDSKISGDPIDQLNETRNPRSFDFSRHPQKDGVYERAGAVMPMERESGNQTRRRQEALRGTFADVLLNASPGVVLASNGSGFDYYRGPRVKPALPRPNAWEVPAPTRPSVVRGMDYMNLAQPFFTSLKLAREGAQADARMNSAAPAWTVETEDIFIPSPAVERASSDPLNDKGANLTGVLALAGILVVAMVVLR